MSVGDASEDRYRTLFERAADAIIIATPDGFIVEGNQSAADLLGYPRAQLAGWRIAEIVVPSERAALAEGLGRINRGETVTTERRLQRADGDVVHAEVRASQLGDGSLLAVIRDISERKRHEAALQETLERTRQLVASLQHGLAVYDRELRFREWNPFMEHVTGRAAADIVGERIADVFPFLEQAGVIPSLRRALAGETVASGDIEAPVPLVGRPLWTSAIHSPLRDASGAIVGVISVVQDVTERRRAEAQRRESEQRWRTMVEQSPIGVLLIDRDGEVTYGNPASLRITGSSPEGILGAGWSAAIHPDDRAGTLAGWREALRREHDFASTGRCLHPDGTVVWWEVRTTAIRVDDQVVGHLCILVDISEQRRAEETRRGLETRLHHGQRLEALGTLAGGIAHDFNNVLGAIFGNLDLARRRVHDGVPPLESLAGIEEASHRARGLIRQILAFSRPELAERRPVALASLVDEVVRLIRSGMPDEIELVVTCGDDVPVVAADPTQLHQILVNLCTNSRHALEGRGGRIAIEVDAVELDAVAELPPGRHARITVSDDGIGMSAATQARAFEPFFTTRAIGEGSGLGLSVVHGLVKAHGGTILLTSELGRGTRFEILLPSSVAAAAARAEAGRRPRILLVDDDPGVLPAATRLLTRAGHEVVAHSNPMAALAAFVAEPASFAAVVTDLAMPRLTGLELARDLRRVAPGVPIALITGHLSEDQSREVAGAGIGAVIYKPDLRTLGGVLGRLIGGKSAGA